MDEWREDGSDRNAPVRAKDKANGLPYGGDVGTVAPFVPAFRPEFEELPAGHGIPGDRKLKEGEILNIDVTPLLDGWHGDTSRMYLVGDVPIKARRLVDVTYECLMLGLEQAKPGNHLGDISHAIQRHAEKHRYGVVRDFCGHGLGRELRGAELAARALHEAGGRVHAHAGEVVRARGVGGRGEPALSRARGATRRHEHPPPSLEICRPKLGTDPFRV